MNDESCVQLQRALEANKSIQELDISGNFFGPEAIAGLFKTILNSKISTLTVKVLIN
jgi:Ran GTPase-activating protein (RanGAP) involved in mRNA processing and transport